MHQVALQCLLQRLVFTFCAQDFTTAEKVVPAQGNLLLLYQRQVFACSHGKTDGLPDFKYVATHICDSMKKKLKDEGVEGIQGEFGIGLLSFWTVGEQMILACGGADGKTYQMEMKKKEPGYRVIQRRALFAHPGTELVIFPLLPGLRQLSGDKIQSYLASELRDRIRRSGVRIKIKDRFSRKEFDVKPRAFMGRPLHEFDAVPTQEGEIHLELYLNTESPDNTVSLFRSGTRVMPAIQKLDFFNTDPWTSGYL